MFLFDFLYLCLLSSIFVSLCLSLSIFVFPYLSLSLVALLCLYLSMFILVCLCLLFSIDFSSFLYLSHLCMSLLVSCLPLNLFTSPKYVVAFLFLFISECFLFFCLNVSIFFSLSLNVPYFTTSYFLCLWFFLFVDRVQFVPIHLYLVNL